MQIKQQRLILEHLSDKKAKLALDKIAHAIKT